MILEVKNRCEVQVALWQVIPETWCSEGYGSIGEHEMRSEHCQSQTIILIQLLYLSPLGFPLKTKMLSLQKVIP